MVIVNKNRDLLALVTTLASFIYLFSKHMKTIYNKNYSRTWGYRSKQAK